MGIREKLNNSPVIGIVIAVVAVGIAIYVLLGFVTGGPSGNAYYTVDDGQTWFEDDLDKVAPFEHGGQQAVRAYVFECDGEEFVGYVERYKPEAAERMRQQQASGAAAPTNPQEAAMAQAQAGGGIGNIEQKRPGDEQWVTLANFVASGEVRDVKCPDGTYPNIVKP